MKLLFALPEFVTHSGGGIITFYRHLLPWLAAHGHAVRVIAGSGVSATRSPSPRMIDGVQVEELDQALLERYSARFSRYSALPGLRRFLAGAWAMWEQAGGGEGFDLVEAADWGLLFLPWVIESAPPAIVQLHGSVGQIDLHDPIRGEEVQGTVVRLMEGRGVASATAAQAYSHANAEAWQCESGRTVDRIHPAWKPISSPIPGSERSTHGLVVGRVQRWKGPEVLCQALRLLGDRAPSIDWVGRDTSFETRSRSTSAQLSDGWPDIWGTRILHKPQQTVEETALLQTRAAFVVVPSTWDTFNFTCVEAMGLGVPVICSTGAGASELIEDGVNGFVFENGDAGALAGVLDRLLSLEGRERNALAEAGRQTVIRELNPEHVGGRRVEAYEAVARCSLRHALPVPESLRLASLPGETPGSDMLHFLDHLPLRELAGHVWRRARGRIRP